MAVIDQIIKHKIVAIIRGAAPDHVIPIAKALHEGGIRLLEITMNSEAPLNVIKRLKAHFGPAMVIGAGTILHENEVADAIEAGASFLLSPIVSTAIIQRTKTLGAVSIPGAYTATEIYQAYAAGADIVKVFPASSPDYIKNIRGPLPEIPLLPTGGVSIENIADYQAAGAVGFGIGSALVSGNASLTEDYLLALTEKSRRLVAAVNV